MGPEDLLFTDRRVIFMIRAVGLAVSVLVSGIIFLTYFGVLGNSQAVLWACWPIGLAMLLNGVAQAVINPYTKNKVLFFVYMYCLIGIFICDFVLGFPTVVDFGWLTLIMIMNIYFGRGIALTGIAMMVISMVIWAIRQGFTLKLSLELFPAFFMILCIVLILSVMWNLELESVNKLRRSQREEAFERRRLISLINSMTDGVVAVDNKHQVNVYNGAALNILDINTLANGAPIRSLFKLIDKNNQPVDIDQLIDSTRTLTTNSDLRFVHTDSSKINLHMDIAPVYGGYHSKNAGFVLIFRDITREKSLEEERDEFISVVSHELRTPIAIAEGNIGNAQFIVNKTGETTKIKEALNAAHEQTLFLADMINDLATLSRAERSKLTFDIDPINVSELVSGLVNTYQDQAKQKNLELTGATTEVNLELRSSSLYVREILQNFVTNALKYTESGSIKIAARSERQGVLFTVADTGIGISRSDQERVFDKFFRAEDFRTRKNNGTGLGLYVTIKLARLLHAEINLESQLNHGSTFSVYVPNLA